MRQLVLTVLASWAAGCASDVRIESGTATWSRDVAPLIAKNCMGCHRDGGIGPFPLTSYGDVVEQAPRMLHAIETGVMPPFYARETDDCTPPRGWRDDPRLSATEVDTFREWIDTGYPRGAAAVVPPPAPPALADVTMTLSANEPWTPSGRTDQFVCVLVDPAVTELTWITGLDVRPSNPRVVHHVQIDEIRDPVQIELAALGVPYTKNCGRGSFRNSFLHLWTPNAQPLDMDGEQLAMALHPGALLELQIHYHPGDVNEPDVTSLDLRLSTVTPRKRYFPIPIGNEPSAPFLLPSADEAPGAEPAFVIPRNAPDHVERMVREVSVGSLTDVRIVSVSPHMHYIGTQITAKITRGDEPAECLANHDWNFDWQRTYRYAGGMDALPRIANGDRIEVACRYNNTTDNPGVLRMLEELYLPPVPVDVGLGSQSTDEMCLETFGVAADT